MDMELARRAANLQAQVEALARGLPITSEASRSSFDLLRTLDVLPIMQDEGRPQQQQQQQQPMRRDVQGARDERRGAVAPFSKGPMRPRPAGVSRGILVKAPPPKPQSGGTFPTPPDTPDVAGASGQQGSGVYVPSTEWKGPPSERTLPNIPARRPPPSMTEAAELLLTLSPSPSPMSLSRCVSLLEDEDLSGLAAAEAKFTEQMLGENAMLASPKLQGIKLARPSAKPRAQARTTFA